MIRSVTASAYLMRSIRLLFEAYAGTELPGWDALERTIRTVHLDPGDVLFSAGEADPSLYLVEEGLLKAQMPDASGRSVISFFTEEGEVLVSMPALAPESVRRVVRRNLHPRAADLQVAVKGLSIHTAVAIEPCVVHRLDYHVLDRLAGQHLQWSRLATAFVMAFGITLEADSATLRNSAEQRYRQLLEARPELVERITRRDLAAYLNVTDVALCRIAKRVEASTA